MKKITLIFISISTILLFFADIEITSLYPFLELSKIFIGILTPKYAILFEFYDAIINTIVFAVCGISLSVIFAVPLAFLYKFTIIKIICSTIRSVHEIFWAILILPVLGLNPFCGIMAIVIPYSGILAKGYFEIFSEADLKTFQYIKVQKINLSAFFYTILPAIYKEIKHFTFYRFECSLKSSAVLGFIGLPTLGFHLESFFKKGFYSECAALLISFYVLIILARILMKEKVVPLYFLISFIAVSKEMVIDKSNIIRFFTYEIVPWPMRREGFLNGSYNIDFNIIELFEWINKIIINEIIPGSWDTIVLTQIAFMVTGLIALPLLFFISRNFINRYLQKGAKLFTVVLRTTPEYIIAYIFVQVFGPSMLPGILAIAIHNGAVVAFLTLESANQIDLSVDAARKKISLYAFEIVPRIYGIFLSNLFYRWEVMVRESALLGILGIYTIGFYVDSAISDDKMDKAIVLIIGMIILNTVISAISTAVRGKIGEAKILVSK